MKSTQECPKCACIQILRIPTFKRENHNQILIKLGWFKKARIYPIRYLCEACGYIEEWIETKSDLATLIKNKSKLSEGTYHKPF